MKNDYRCKYCMKIVQRDSDKAWVKSYCDESGRTVHLVRIQPRGREVRHPARPIT